MTETAAVLDSIVSAVNRAKGIGNPTIWLCGIWFWANFCNLAVAKESRLVSDMSPEDILTSALKVPTMGGINVCLDAKVQRNKAFLLDGQARVLATAEVEPETL